MISSGGNELLQVAARSSTGASASSRASASSASAAVALAKQVLSEGGTSPKTIVATDAKGVIDAAVSAVSARLSQVKEDLQVRLRTADTPSERQSLLQGLDKVQAGENAVNGQASPPASTFSYSPAEAQATISARQNAQAEAETLVNRQQSRQDDVDAALAQQQTRIDANEGQARQDLNQAADESATRRWLDNVESDRAYFQQVEDEQVAQLRLMSNAAFNNALPSRPRALMASPRGTARPRGCSTFPLKRLNLRKLISLCAAKLC